ncbi:hypothetical protein M885DRAFT_541518 [Pelagophyceae sp. CCMP2097]|nr:hypothetical protein M885DRAFT_541518 [Pelagophyceae sp. CCMP2097]
MARSGIHIAQPKPLENASSLPASASSSSSLLASSTPFCTACLNTFAGMPSKFSARFALASSATALIVSFSFGSFLGALSIESAAAAAAAALSAATLSTAALSTTASAAAGRPAAASGACSAALSPPAGSSRLVLSAAVLPSWNS